LQRDGVAAAEGPPERRRHPGRGRNPRASAAAASACIAVITPGGVAIRGSQRVESPHRVVITPGRGCNRKGHPPQCWGTEIVTTHGRGFNARATSRRLQCATVVRPGRGRNRTSAGAPTTVAYAGLGGDGQRPALSGGARCAAGDMHTARPTTHVRAGGRQLTEMYSWSSSVRYPVTPREAHMVVMRGPHSWTARSAAAKSARGGRTGVVSNTSRIGVHTGPRS